jgi:hypothetical protein
VCSSASSTPHHRHLASAGSRVSPWPTKVINSLKRNADGDRIRRDYAKELQNEEQNVHWSSYVDEFVMRQHLAPLAQRVIDELERDPEEAVAIIWSWIEHLDRKCRSQAKYQQLDRLEAVAHVELIELLELHIPRDLLRPGALR